MRLGGSRDQCGATDTRIPSYVNINVIDRPNIDTIPNLRFKTSIIITLVTSVLIVGSTNVSFLVVIGDSYPFVSALLRLLGRLILDFSGHLSLFLELSLGCPW